MNSTYKKGGDNQIYPADPYTVLHVLQKGSNRHYSSMTDCNQ